MEMLETSAIYFRQFLQNSICSLSLHPFTLLGFPGGSAVKNLSDKAGSTGDAGSIPGPGRFPWRRKWQPIPIFFPGKSHVQRSPAVYRSMGSQGVRHNWAHIHSFTLLITNMEEQGLAIIFQERTRYGHPLWALHCQLWWLVYFPISMYSHVTVGLSHHNYISCLWKSSRKWKKKNPLLQVVKECTTGRRV